jgi:hypothetical protein
VREESVVGGRGVDMVLAGEGGTEARNRCGACRPDSGFILATAWAGVTGNIARKGADGRLRLGGGSPRSAKSNG